MLNKSHYIETVEVGIFPSLCHSTLVQKWINVSCVVEKYLFHLIGLKFPCWETLLQTECGYFPPNTSALAASNQAQVTHSVSPKTFFNVTLKKCHLSIFLGWWYSKGFFSNVINGMSEREAFESLWTRHDRSLEPDSRSNASRRQSFVAAYKQSEAHAPALSSESTMFALRCCVASTNDERTGTSAAFQDQRCKASGARAASAGQKSTEPCFVSPCDGRAELRVHKVWR